MFYFEQNAKRLLVLKYTLIEVVKASYQLTDGEESSIFLLNNDLVGFPAADPDLRDAPALVLSKKPGFVRLVNDLGLLY